MVTKTEMAVRSAANDSLLSPSTYDSDAGSVRSDQDSDSDDDERQLRARNSRELRAHDRIVLMEEEEMDQLVTDARHRDRSWSKRRGSNLALPLSNPLQLFRNRSRSPAKPAVGQPDDSISSDVEEMRKQRRRRRRKEKKAKLLDQAQEGEDGELMFEMEQGGLKDGSVTGSSSGQDDDDEMIEKDPQWAVKRSTKRTNKCCRWLLIHMLIATLFAILVLTAWRLSEETKLKAAQKPLLSNGTALFAPTTIIFSLDGFRADFLQRGITPRLSALIKEGVSPQYMRPSFPSVTFPNHYTLATGLYPESHGVVGNSFWDPELQAEFYYTDPARSMDPKWWKGEPFWVTAEEQGIRTAVHMWPGSEAHIDGVEPTYLDAYNGKEDLDNKVHRIFELLDKPGLEHPDALADRRPQLIAAYVPNVDADGHKYGPNSTEIMLTIQHVDTMMDNVFQGLQQRNLTDIVNIIVVSDHGMATTDVERLIQMEDLIDVDKIAHTDGWPLVGLRPKDSDDLEGLHEELKVKAQSNPNFDVYLRDVDMPERYHFSRNDRIAPLWIVPKTGWAIVTKKEFDIEQAKANGLVYHPRGLHGYDHEHPLMRAIFIARGPAFPHQPNSRLENFQNTEVYNILCDSLGMTPIANNGTLRLPLKPIGLHDGASAPEVPADPVTSYTITPTVQSTSTSTSKAIVSTDATTSSSTTTASSIILPSATPTDTVVPPDAHDDDDESGSDRFSDLWDWLTGKLGSIWGKITGPKTEAGQDGREGGATD